MRSARNSHCLKSGTTDQKFQVMPFLHLQAKKEGEREKEKERKSCGTTLCSYSCSKTGGLASASSRHCEKLLALC